MEILVVDDQEAVCECIAEKIQRSVDASYSLVVRPIFRLSDVASHFKQSPYPKLIMLDLDLGATRGLDTLKAFQSMISQLVPIGTEIDTAVAIFSGANFLSLEGANVLRRAMKDFGVKGIIPKNGQWKTMLIGLERFLNGETWLPDDLMKILLVSPQGGVRLTPRELEVASLVAKGLEDKEIAKELDLQHTTVRQIVSRILGKFDVGNRTKFALLYEKQSI